MVYTPKDWSNGDTVDATEMDRIEEGIQQSVPDVRTRAYWDVDMQDLSEQNSTFVTVALPTVDYNVGGGSWSNNLWTCPASGLYFCTAKVRIRDSAAARSVGVGIGTSNADGPHFAWRNMGGVTRDTLVYLREFAITANDQIRLYLYSDGQSFPWQINTPGNGSRAEMTIRRVR